MPTRKNSTKSLPPLPTVASYSSISSDHARTESPRRRKCGCGCATTGCIRTTFTILTFTAYVLWWWFYARAADGDTEIDPLDREAAATSIIHAPPLGVPRAMQTKWAMYSPWHALAAYEPPPEGCNITQVNILQRHGARYPNGDDGEQYGDGVKHLAAADKFIDKKLKFMKGYEYDLGADDLVPFGAAQTFESGQIAFKRYEHLVDPHNVPFVRAAGAPRVVSTATNWTVGFAAASHQRVQPYLNTIISEEVNNTLNQDCPNAPDGSRETSIWLSVFGPRIVARLNRDAPGAKLNVTHVFGLLAMCPFESVAKEVLSPFCALFDDEDFRAFEYYGDLEKYYRTGYGAPLGRIRGVGYVNELLARLTDKPVQDHTTHNASLEFPLGRTVYADFTHENLMVAVYAALGLFNVSEPLDPRASPQDGGAQGGQWVASRMVPFSSRMVTERLSCERDGEARTYVRVLVNDEVQPLELCGGGQEKMCALGDFVKSQGYARRSGDGDFLKCYN